MVRRVNSLPYHTTISTVGTFFRSLRVGLRMDLYIVVGRDLTPTDATQTVTPVLTDLTHEGVTPTPLGFRPVVRYTHHP